MADTQDNGRKDRHKVTIIFRLDHEDERRADALLMSSPVCKRETIVRALLIAYGGEEPVGDPLQETWSPTTAPVRPEEAADGGGSPAAPPDRTADWSAELVSLAGSDTLRIAF